MTENKLFYGDNLDILRNVAYFPDECVDLIYLDPPFNSSRNYNVLFADESGSDSEAQITAFKDTWHWGETAEETYYDLIEEAPHGVDTAIDAMMTLIGRNQMMAYLVMMAARLVELHRVLKPTGSLYLHCDPTASHYLNDRFGMNQGFDAFREARQRQFAAFDNVEFEAAEQRIRLAESGDVAWFSETFDLFLISQNQQAVGLEGLRLTGVLERRDGRWQIVQLHTSLPVRGQAAEY